MKPHRIHLTPAQRSALECAGIDAKIEPRLRAAWGEGNQWLYLPLERAAVEELATELCELSNAEDACAQQWSKEGKHDCARGARGAAVALGTLYGKVLHHVETLPK